MVASVDTQTQKTCCDCAKRGEETTGSKYKTRLKRGVKGRKASVGPNKRKVGVIRQVRGGNGKE